MVLAAVQREEERGKYEEDECYSHPACNAQGDRDRDPPLRALAFDYTRAARAADHAMRVAYKEVVAANDRKFQFLPGYAQFADQLRLVWGDPVHRGLDGLLAGISVALGFLFPPRSRVVRCPGCSRVVERQRAERGIAIPIALGITGGMALAFVLLILAALLFAL